MFNPIEEVLKRVVDEFGNGDKVELPPAPLEGTDHTKVTVVGSPDGGWIIQLHQLVDPSLN